MSHFYGILKGSRGETTRCGTKNSGVRTTCASWNGAIRTVLYDKNGEDWYRVEQTMWEGKGVYRVIAEGKVGE